MKKIFAFVMILCFAATLCACGDENINISQPESINAVEGTDYVTENDGAVEDSYNVNGKRFNLTLYEFTSRYNAEKKKRGDNSLLDMGAWKKNGQVNKDSNGVKIQYYYYDEDESNLTATVEADTEKLVNIGCGTTTGQFTAKENGKNKSDAILLKSATMAQVACGFDEDSVNTLQTIFYKTATGSDKNIWHDGFVFSFSTKDNHTGPDDKLVLFRVFPISEELRQEWKLPEY